MVAGKAVQCFFAHEPVVSVVADNIDPHFFHQAVKTHGGGAFESRVRIPGAAHTVNDLRPFMIFLYKLIQHFNIILQVGIQRNGDVAQFPGCLLYTS